MVKGIYFIFCIWNNNKYHTYTIHESRKLWGIVDIEKKMEKKETFSICI